MMHMRYFILLLCVGFVLGSDTVPAKYCKLYNLLGLMDMTTADKLSPTINYYEKAYPYLRISSKTLTLVQSGEVMNVVSVEDHGESGVYILTEGPALWHIGKSPEADFYGISICDQKGEPLRTVICGLANTD